MLKIIMLKEQKLNDSIMNSSLRSVNIPLSAALAKEGYLYPQSVQNAIKRIARLQLTYICFSGNILFIPQYTVFV